MRVMIIGCGDVGLRVANLHREAGDDVTGLVRSDASAKRLSAAGIRLLKTDLDLSLPDAALDDAEIVYIFTPPPRSGVEDPRLANALQQLACTPPKHIVYISSTAVYGDQQSRVVTEDTPPAPNSDRGRRRLAAELATGQFCEKFSCNLTILRVAAIYGPGKLPLKRLQQGLAVLDAGISGPGNRIHVDDLARICFAAGTKPNGKRLFNVADNHPLSQADYLDLLANMMELPKPPRMTWREAEATLTESQLGFLRERRQVDASRILNTLNIKLKYASPLDGLRASLAEECR